MRDDNIICNTIHKTTQNMAYRQIIEILDHKALNVNMAAVAVFLGLKCSYQSNSPLNSL